MFYGLHAAQGNPPSTVTGRVGAVGHIHLICKKVTFLNGVFLTKGKKEKQKEINNNAYIWKRKIVQEL